VVPPEQLFICRCALVFANFHFVVFVALPFLFFFNDFVTEIRLQHSLPAEILRN